MAALTEEQTMIQHQAESWVTKNASVQEFRDVRDGDSEVEFSPQIWNEMVSMGWAGIIIPEAYGGSDLGYLTFGLILEQTGRQLSACLLYTFRAHETVLDLVCRLLLEKKKHKTMHTLYLIFTYLSSHFHLS